MSLSTLLKQVRDHLRTRGAGKVLTPTTDLDVADTANEVNHVIRCEPEPGQPPFGFTGKVFIAVWSPGRNPWSDMPGGGQAPNAHHEEMELIVTITQRIGSIPQDELANQFIIATASMEDTARKIERALHMEYTNVIAAANTTLGLDPSVDSDGFTEPLQWQGTNQPRAVGPEWYNINTEQGPTPAGYVMDIRFGGAKRIKCLD